MGRRTRKLLGGTLVVIALTATPAFAHVTANPREVAAGEFTVLTFRVPNESDTESTVALEVAFPEAATFRSVSVKPTPGWNHAIERDGDDVRRITWQGGEIAPGEFMEFDVSVGPVPDVDALEFKALQTYSDGEVVRWIDPPGEDGEEPEHPAPLVAVVDAEGDHGEATAGGGTEGSDGTEPATFVALVLAGFAVVTALAALVMVRNRVPK